MTMRHKYLYNILDLLLCPDSANTASLKRSSPKRAEATFRKRRTLCHHRNIKTYVIIIDFIHTIRGEGFILHKDMFQKTLVVLKKPYSTALCFYCRIIVKEHLKKPSLVKNIKSNQHFHKKSHDLKPWNYTKIDVCAFIQRGSIAENEDEWSSCIGNMW